jgi:chorismate mutase / prephenate dehydratase
MKRVAYLGPEGTFSGILCRRRFGVSAPLAPCESIEAVFDDVVGGASPLGLVPVENSSGGTVHDTIDLLVRHQGTVFIREELALDIRIALLGHKGTRPRTVYSHFTQITHHRERLAETHPGARLVPVASTAEAAIRAAGSRTAAALSSPGAAEIYGLDILEGPRRDDGVNVTHFFVIGREPSKSAKANRTAFIAELPNRCGSLHRFLGPFDRKKVSLTRIISRPVPGKPQTYVFYVEIEGSPRDPRVDDALRLAGARAASLGILGSFPTGRHHRS